VARWHGGEWTEEVAQQKAAGFDEGWKRDGVNKWIAYDRQTDELVGRGGLSYAMVDGERQLEVGWTVRDRFVGHGYATEIGGAGLNFAFNELGAANVVSFTEVENQRSRAVMDRLGMHYAWDIVHDGEPFALYSLARSEWTDRAH
jgi:RimJ/RimL family protein N-acetyltransferase